MTENFSQGASQTISGCDRVVTSIKYEGPWEATEVVLSLDS